MAAIKLLTLSFLIRDVLITFDVFVSFNITLVVNNAEREQLFRAKQEKKNRCSEKTFQKGFSPY